MNYVVTGATGFIGKFLIEQLLQDEGVTVHALVREGSETKFEALESRFSSLPGTLVRLPGDVTQADLVSAAQLKKLVGKVQHVFHLAAVYDMDMSDDTANRINIEGTRNVLAFVKALGGEVLRLTRAAILRWGPPDSAFTMDYREDRLNIVYDAKGTIERIYCG